MILENYRFAMLNRDDFESVVNSHERIDWDNSLVQ